MSRLLCTGTLVALGGSGLFASGAVLSGDRASLPGIRGTDDRVLVPTTDYPWSAIGRVNSTLGEFCTGTLVGPRRVLTAAHCLWNRHTQRWLPPCAVHFVAGYQRDQYLGHSLVLSYAVAGEPTLPARPPPRAQDWAILTLAEDVAGAGGALETAPLDVARLQAVRKQGEVFMRAGYSRDRPHRLTRHEGCPVLGLLDGGRLALHECDATYGDSGSPLLLRTAEGYRLVAIHLATDPGTDRGLALTGTVFDAHVRSLPPPPPVDPGFKACALPDPAADSLALR